MNDLDKFMFDLLRFQYPHTVRSNSVNESARNSNEHKSDIEKIIVNKNKKVVVVLFKDHTKQIIKTQKGDHFDWKVGVAIAIAKHQYGSTTQFYKDIDSKVIFSADKSKGE